MSHQLGPHGTLLACLACLAEYFVVRSKDVGSLFLRRTMPSQKLHFGKELALVGRSWFGLLLLNRYHRVAYE
jgi:hypothetical protein